MSFKFKRVNLTLAALLSTFTISCFADTINVNIQCPRTKDDGGSSGVFVLFNTGAVISGTGIEIINGVQAANIIIGGPTPVGVPGNLRDGGYFRNGVSYDSAGSKIICHYNSVVNYPPFDISYNLRRGTGGTVAYSTPSSIMIRYNFGDPAPDPARQ